MNIEQLIKNLDNFKNLKSILRLNTIDRHISTIHVYLLKFNNNSKKKLFIKINKYPQNKNTQKTLKFYQSNYKEITSNKFIKFPKIFYFDETIMIEEFVDGKNLEEILSEKEISHLQEIFYDVGRGLGQINNLTAENFYFINFLKRFKKNLAILPPNLSNKINCFVLKNLSEEDFKGVKVFNLGDFQLKNLILSESENIYAVDIEPTFGPKFIGACQFIINFKIHLLKPSFFFRKKKIAKVLLSFVNGFFNNEEINYRMFNFFFLYLLIQRLAAINSSAYSFITKRYIHWHLISMIKFLINNNDFQKLIAYN